MEIRYSARFKKMYDKLDKKIQEQVKQKLGVFMSDVHDPQLRTHKLKGVLKKYWAFRINYKVRICFSFKGKYIELHTVGGHEVYEKLEK